MFFVCQHRRLLALVCSMILYSGINFLTTHRPDGQSPDSLGRGMWPLRPGVLVHVGKLNHVNISRLSPEITPFKTTSVTKSNAFFKYRRNKSKVYARLQRLKNLLGFNGHDHVPSGITEGASGGKY